MAYNVVDNFRYCSSTEPNFERDAYDSLVAANAAAIRGDLEPGHLIFIRGSEVNEETKGQRKTFRYLGIKEDGTGYFQEFGEVDSELTEDGTNPVQGRIIKVELDKKQDVIDTVLTINEVPYKVGDEVTIDTSIPIDNTLDPTSENPISNSAITQALNSFSLKEHKHTIEDIVDLELNDISIEELKKKISEDDLRLNGESIELELEDDSAESVLSNLVAPSEYNTYKVYVNNEYRGLISNTKFGTIFLLDDSIYNWLVDSTSVGDINNMISVGELYWSPLIVGDEYPVYTWGSKTAITSGDYTDTKSEDYLEDDDPVVLKKDDDVIVETYASNWKIPTKEEAQTFISGISNIETYNGNLIITSTNGSLIEIPYSPYYRGPGKYLNNEDSLFFWTSSINEEDKSEAWAIRLISGEGNSLSFDLVSVSRDFALPVLGVFCKSWVKLRTITDAVLNENSTNPIQNKVVAAKFKEMINDEEASANSTWSSSKISSFINDNPSLRTRIVTDINSISDPDTNTIYMCKLPEEDQTENNIYDEFLYIVVDEVNEVTGTVVKKGIFERIGSSGNKKFEKNLEDRLAILESFHMSFSYTASVGVQANSTAISKEADYHKLYYSNSNENYYVRSFYCKDARVNYSNNGVLVESNVPREFTSAKLTLGNKEYIYRNSSTGVFVDDQGNPITDKIGSGSNQTGSYDSPHTASISWTCQPHDNDKSGTGNSWTTSFDISITYPKIIIFLGASSENKITQANVGDILKKINSTNGLKEEFVNGIKYIPITYSKTAAKSITTSTISKKFSEEMSIYVATSDQSLTNLYLAIKALGAESAIVPADLSNGSSLSISNHNWRVWSSGNQRWGEFANYSITATLS